VAVLGPSGAGKSLLHKAFAGLVQPARGRVSIGTRTLYDSDKGIWLRPDERRVGYVPQHFALFPYMTILQNVLFATNAKDVARNSPRALTQDSVIPLRIAGQANANVIPLKISTGDLPNVVATRSRGGSTSSKAVRGRNNQEGVCHEGLSSDDASQIVRQRWHAELRKPRSHRRIRPKDHE